VLEAIRNFGQSGAILLLGLAIGAAWIVAIVSPNTSYDHLKGKNADQHVRELLKSASDPIAVLLLVACALSILGGAMASGIASLIAAIGFFTNRWTLASSPSRKSSESEQTVGKTRRILAVSLTMVFSLLAIAAAIFAVLGR
jgi:Na+/proline symporter